jgi:pyruvate ferredoxin oxidoreductase gamma subunit
VVEFRFHGRYGQPVGKITRTLAKELMVEGKHVQVFDSFGAFRPDAPTYSVLRVSAQDIVERSVNETFPDVVIVLDNSLFEVTDVTKGMRTDGILLAYGVDSDVLGEQAATVKFIKLDPFIRKEAPLERELLQAFKQINLIP